MYLWVPFSFKIPHLSKKSCATQLVLNQGNQTKDRLVGNMCMDKDKQPVMIPLGVKCSWSVISRWISSFIWYGQNIFLMNGVYHMSSRMSPQIEKQRDSILHPLNMETGLETEGGCGVWPLLRLVKWDSAVCPEVRYPCKGKITLLKGHVDAVLCLSFWFVREGGEKVEWHESIEMLSYSERDIWGRGYKIDLCKVAFPGIPKTWGP